ncbi:nucleotidyltransferase, partial [Candidatus Saccharibacteria bacterium]|nr:nucleotidyltransferase [Candidatus Saccharibacteria bacterium]
MSISEEQLSNWTNPPSDTEDERAENAIAMVKDAINSDDKLKYLDLDIFCQGSYANNTNVRLDSDV